jgi:flagellar basal body-associated protein FliL
MVLCDTSGSAVSLVVAFSQADAVAWICLVIGILVLAAGVATGLWTSFKNAPKKTEEAIARIDEAQASITEAKVQIEQTTSAVADANLEGFESAAGNATEAAQAAEESTEAARSALQQVQDIVASLPENLRFAGLLILVGAVLISVATIQFGGVSLF